MFNQQMTIDGRSEDIAPASRQDRLFVPVEVMAGQTSMAACADCGGTGHLTADTEPDCDFPYGNSDQDTRCPFCDVANWAHE